VASPLVDRGIHLLCLSRRFWRRGTYIVGYGDVMMEVAIPIRCVPTCNVSNLDHGIQWHVGACNVEKCFAGEHVDAWKCAVVRGFSPWSGRSNLNHINFSSGVIDALTHMGYHMVHGGMIVSIGI